MQVVPISHQSIATWSYLAPFLRYGQLLAENCAFFIPLSYSVSPLPEFPLEFCGEGERQKTTLCLKKGTPIIDCNFGKD